ncbi:FkbM family methyltransferase [Cyanobium sp. N5-Cardenillas]|uniref:FkbM family methyltransferase n=1 Tax=Cyanobium sp. N5-Cardenillas TaxID=2823720 RepID=UPI0020CF48CC|nr:FkbM family methyltransferase [Cyanobium sp. N5-Cardenillas]MCP9785019.1 FkbM family methyltransferase [Cyanobium sp. N5-Cardenillas]
MIVDKIKTLLRPLRKALRKPPDRFLMDVSGVVHVGANLGQERELYSTHGLRVVWVEPIPEVFTQLNYNICGFKSQRAFQALVTDVDDKQYEFHVANNDGASSSILELKQHRDIWPGVHYSTTLILKSITLASLFLREHLDASQYQALIMDTQGSELLVLRGSLPILNSFKYIKTEVPDFESYEGCCQLSGINEFMIEHGYKEFSRVKFASRAEGGNYFDVVYKRHA